MSKRLRARRQSGMTLIELMVALAIDAFLLIGAIAVFMQSRSTLRVAESVARLQENARFALDALELEVRMARYWGLTSMTASIVNRARASAANGPGIDTCGNNWVIDLDEAVAGDNNRSGFACAPYGAAAAAADTLVVRRASTPPEPPPLAGASTLRIQSVRGAGASEIFVGASIPAGFDAATSETHRLLVNGFYVDRTSALPGVPSLRVKTLLTDGTIQDQEVVAGVEDLQVQLGVDTDAAGMPGRGAVDRYLDADDPLIDPASEGFAPGAAILAVRLWVRVRAERPENGFTDTTAYAYADRTVAPFNDGFRRVVVSKTIQLRNARPAS